MTEPSVLQSPDELTKLKLSDLKKVCKQLGIATSGTKVEIISRITDKQGDSYTILQPGDEAKLLGDEDDEVSLDASGSLISNLTPDSKLIQPTPKSTGSTGVAVKRPAPSSDEPHSLTHIDSLTVSASAETVPNKLTAVENVDTKTPFRPSHLSNQERLSVRAERFGLSANAGSTVGVWADEKLAARAKRFGLPVGGANEFRSGGESSLNHSGASADVEKLRQRAERFGETTSKALEKMSEDERKAKRLEKFGSSNFTPSATVQANPTDDQAKKEARAIKFGLPTSSVGGVVLDEEKLLQRKQRFGVA